MCVTGPLSFAVAVLVELATETGKYAFPRRNFEARNLEEVLMSGGGSFMISSSCRGYCVYSWLLGFFPLLFWAVPDLETVKFRVLKRTEEYEIREVEVKASVWF